MTRRSRMGINLRRWFADSITHSYEPTRHRTRPPSMDPLTRGQRSRAADAKQQARETAAALKEEIKQRDPARREPKWRRAARLGSRGLGGPGGGAMEVVDVIPTFRATTVQACGLFPFVVGDTHPMVGSPHGINLKTGGTFNYDPISATYRARLHVTPSCFLLGLPSYGKSSVARKMIAGAAGQNQIPFVFADTKGEHVNVVKDLGGKIIRLGHGHGQLNPLALGALGSIIVRLQKAGREDLARLVSKQVHSRRKRLLQGLCEIERESALGQTERNLLGAALRILDADPQFGPDTLPPVINDLIELIESAPDALIRKVLAADKAHYNLEVKPLLQTLTALVDGDLGDVFAGQTSDPIDLIADPPPAICVDISSITSGDEKLEAAVMYACWEDGFGAIEAAHVLADAGLAPQRHFLAVLDELWRVLSAGPGMVGRIDAVTRLTRTLGTALMMITHTVKDLETLAADMDIQKAKGFIERAGALIVGALPREEMDKLDAIIPFTRADRDTVSSWSTPGAYDPDTQTRRPPPGRGSFMLKIGTERVPGTPFKTVFTPIEIERKWHETDARFSGAMTT